MITEELSYGDYDDQEQEYALWLMEATFNYQNAFQAETLQNSMNEPDFAVEEVTEELIIDNGTNGGGATVLLGASMIEKYINAFQNLNSALGTGEYYVMSDFEITQVTGTTTTIAARALKVITAGIPTGPIGANEEWFAANKAGMCDGSGNYQYQADATTRMNPIVFRNNYGFRTSAFKYIYNYNVSSFDLGVTTYTGPKSSQVYCGLPWSKNPYITVPGCGVTPSIVNACMNKTTMDGIILNLDYAITSENPTNKYFIGSSMRGPKATVSNYPRFWQHFIGNYGSEGVLDTKPQSIF